jgi:hypothetical protein
MTERNDGILRSARMLAITGVRSCAERGFALNNSAVEAAATASSATFIQMMGMRSVGFTSCPANRVPDRKAADAAPRIQPYSNGFPAITGLAALTASASARDVTGARAAAWTMATARTTRKLLAGASEAAATAAMTIQVASNKAQGCQDVGNSAD